MKLMTIFLFIFCLATSARTFSQKITLREKNASLEKIFREIKKQSDYSFIYKDEVLQQANKVDVSFKNVDILEALKICFSNQPLTYSIIEKTIVVKQKSVTTTEVLKVFFPPPLIDVKGRVVNEKGEPVEGVTVTVRGTRIATATNQNGEFQFTAIDENATLTFTSTDMETMEVLVIGKTDLAVKLKTKIVSLNDIALSTGYWNTTQGQNTGNISKVKGEEIGRQPISNPFAALQGRVPGLFIRQSNGFPGSNFDILIRGRNSIQQGTNPLIILDGVPLSTDKMRQTGLIDASNPFNTIDPADIASIEVLKDADATSIYGSRGANGVILITTKRFKAEKPELNFNISYGWGKVTRTMDYMNTEQYLQMRKEAFANDGAVPNLSNAVDLLVWDSSRYTNWTKELLGNTANVFNTTMRYSAGTALTKVSVHGGFYKEETVFPGDFGNNRINSGISLVQYSKDRKFSGDFVIKYSVDKSKLSSSDLTESIDLAPNAPGLYDSSGNIRWYEKGLIFYNPAGLLLQKNTGVMSRLSISTNMQYRILKGLTARVNTGYNKASYDETSSTPIKSQHPSGNPRGSAAFASSDVETIIIEPQADYSTKLRSLSIQVTLGGSFQKSSHTSSMMRGSGYTNDLLLQSIGGAATVTSSNNKELYQYSAGYTRLSFNYDNRYLLNLTGRRDGSSRFGPGNQFANFGAIGTAWIFSKEKFVREQASWLSYGKIRGSYGITGNDQIRNYQYLDTWTTTSYTYGGTAVLRPTKLFNPDYRWEQSKKMELGLELGFLQDRILVNASWFRNLSGNQIINSLLPAQTGFTTILMNFPGLVQNSGLEFSLTTINLNKAQFRWSTTFNITHHRNRLLEFPGLESSSYAGRYYIDQPLNINSGYEFKGVNPQTGVYEYTDQNNDGILNTRDHIITGSTDPKFYGGLDNMIQLKNLEISFLLQFVKQNGRHFIYSNSSKPGFNAVNQFSYLTERWTKPGDVSLYQKYTATSGTPAFNAGNLIYMSSAIFTDASYIRLKTLSLSYEIGKNMKRVSTQSVKIFLQAQNLFTITSYIGGDPEGGNRISLPPIRMITAGFQLKL